MEASAASAAPADTKILWRPAQSAITPTGSRKIICVTP